MMLEFDDLPRDFLMKYPERIDRVAADDLRRTAGRFLNPEKTATLVLGNEKAFEVPLSTAGEVIKIEGGL
jgi:predicted Zn-dependent peptidase